MASLSEVTSTFVHNSPPHPNFEGTCFHFESRDDVLVHQKVVQVPLIWWLGQVSLKTRADWDVDLDSKRGGVLGHQEML